MLLAFPNALLAGQHPQKPRMNPLVEGAQRRPSFEIKTGLGIAKVIGQMLQHLALDASEPAALRDEPGIEGGAAVQFETVQKLARESIGHSAQGRQGLQRDALRGDPVELQGIDMAARQVEAHRVALGPDPAGFAHEAPDLAQGPAQLAARVVRHVPQQLAEMASRQGMGRESQIGEEGAHLARSRQRDRSIAAHDREGAEHPHRDGRSALRVCGLRRFHGRSHAASHALLHVWLLRSLHWV
jgi:hypothetical protein